MSFYNTNQLEGNALRDACKRAKNQEEAILTYFLNKREAFSPSEIMEKMQSIGRNWPITSVRRAMTDLTTKGHLVKTSEMIPGEYNVQVHKWMLNARKYPTQTATQSNLFNDQANAA